MLKSYEIKGLFTGKAKHLSNGQESAIHKNLVQELNITKTHIINDEVVDLVHHGGEERVIHHYSKVNYDHLKTTFPEIAERFIPGSFGENLYTEELTESELCIGDIFKAGSTKIQVTVPRRPCATINAGYEDSRILKEVLASGHVGWFFKVIQEGSIKLGDQLVFIERPNPDLTLTKLFEQGYGKQKFANKDFLKECQRTGLMDKGWKPKIEKALN